MIATASARLTTYDDAITTDCAVVAAYDAVIAALTTSLAAYGDTL